MKAIYLIYVTIFLCLLIGISSGLSLLVYGTSIL